MPILNYIYLLIITYYHGLSILSHTPCNTIPILVLYVYFVRLCIVKCYNRYFIGYCNFNIQNPKLYHVQMDLVPGTWDGDKLLGRSSRRLSLHRGMTCTARCFERCFTFRPIWNDLPKTWLPPSSHFKNHAAPKLGPGGSNNLAVSNLTCWTFPPNGSGETQNRGSSSGSNSGIWWFTISPPSWTPRPFRPPALKGKQVCS